MPLVKHNSMALRCPETFLFTSESVGEGHSGDVQVQARVAWNSAQMNIERSEFALIGYDKSIGVVVLADV